MNSYLTKPFASRSIAGWILSLAACGLVINAPGQTRTLRVVTYNIEADVNSNTTPLPGLITPSGSTNVLQGGVLEGIGEEIVGGDKAQPIDVLALEETTSNPATVAPIVSGLNAFYNAPGMYAMSSYQAKESGNSPTVGNGPNAMVYNTTTLQLVASTPVEPPSPGTLGSTSGELREVVRYEFAPAGVTPAATNEFYVYVSHYKSSASGTEATDEAEREGEAVIIRNDEAAHLPSNARVLYVGDYNIGGSGEASYQTMLASNSPSNVVQGQGVDPFNLSGATNIDWTVNSLLSQKSDSSTSLHYRDDLEVMTTNVFNGTPGGLAYVAGTYHNFANNGTVHYETSTTSGTDTALNSDLTPGAPISASQIYQDLTTGSDHLPVVADYTIPIPPPPVASFNGNPTNGNVPLAVTFTDTSTGTVTNRSWNFGDGTTTNITTATVQHTYNAPGVYGVTEIASGPFGAGTNIQAGYITALPPAPVANFNGTPTNGVAPLMVTFTDTSSGSITNWFWDFGDGVTTNISGTTIQHSYTNAGVYDVTEIVTGAGGASTNLQAAYITVTNLPVSTFVFTSLTVTNGTVTLNWPTDAGKVYGVDVSSNLTTWIPLITNLSGTGSNITLSTNADFSPEFFRLNHTP